jgi:hypothetical protein
MNATWQALSREASLAAEQMGTGVTVLAKANYAHHAHYPQAFFALSIGIERAAKLALLLEHAIQNGGRFPANRQLRDYGHNLKSLLSDVDQINMGEYRLPATPIHNAILETLSEFAMNITRYYNLDFVTNAPNVQTREDPIAKWFRTVISPVYEQCVPARKKAQIEHNARLIERLTGSITMVMHHAEDGSELTSVGPASQQTGMLEAAMPHVRLHVLQLVRFLGSVLSEQGYRAHAAEMQDVPFLSAYFAIFNNDDAMLKSRKTWSIYNP